MAHRSEKKGFVQMFPQINKQTNLEENVMLQRLNVSLGNNRASVLHCSLLLCALDVGVLEHTALVAIDLESF